MEFIDMRFWVAVQLAIDLILVGLILYFFRNLRTGLTREAKATATQQLIGMLEPLLKEADSTSQTFEAQLQEKSRLINRLNEQLDSRIISLNLLLNRAESYLKASDQNPGLGHGHVYDQQQAIVDLYQKGVQPDEIASRLALPRGEVELVLDLKKKFLNL